ncbi:AAA family ATPase [Brachyspira hyodysenteriae]|uniref:AAA family ATPase n=1 Tax=Brachyspira hyodysenteriae TaxID=159 RepID=UPI0022CDEC93|nr:AAA family ATPase [Brachyspira hyodysenteriae]MCZ9939129.1 AAA family ATPase [Brachyspira hyodysenteriae]
MSDENAIELLDESPSEELSDSLPHKQTCNNILNIINNKKLLRKVILLSGVRGAGKTTIIQKLIKENEKDKNKVFITIDAWNAPEDVLKKEFFKMFI